MSGAQNADDAKNNEATKNLNLNGQFFQSHNYIDENKNRTFLWADGTFSVAENNLDLEKLSPSEAGNYTLEKLLNDNLSNINSGLLARLEKNLEYIDKVKADKAASNQFRFGGQQVDLKFSKWYDKRLLLNYGGSKLLGAISSAFEKFDFVGMGVVYSLCCFLIITTSDAVKSRILILVIVKTGDLLVACFVFRW